MNKIEPIHPGEILKEEFMEPLSLSQNSLAKALHVSPRRINEIVNARRAVTADTALRLARFFGNSPEFWMNLQNRYDLEKAKDRSFATIEKEVERLAAS
ncbi:HigA family addiction module antitoxin [Nitratifractor sp.]